MKAVILAGGFGKRLKPLTNDRPKPMIEISGIPILEWQIDWLHRHGVSEVVICIGYLREMVINHIGSGRKYGVKIGYSVEEEPLGTGGALKNAGSLLHGESFFAMNGDILTDLDPWKLAKDAEEGMGSIAAVPLQSPYGIIEIDDGLARGFREKPILEDYWINAGVYCLSTKILDALPDQGNLEATTLPELAKDGKLRVTKYNNANWRSIDTHKDIEEAQKQFEHLRPSYPRENTLGSQEKHPSA
ncbi:MAG: nucleotidyltransferase family protein [Nitrososphaerota archaeon]|nr:nucleotidyltransferase family protein [Nitrososphaerota archaeon]